jgi:alpha-beta hydrolase superfamily lysophospholipase
MRRDDFSFNSEDGLEIAYYRWRAPGKAVAIVQIAHGMGEHSLRYAHVAEFLNQNGFHVYANDHRGHGRTAKGRESLGDFGSGGWNGLVADMVTLTRMARTREGRLPVVLLGHSMGSFAAQQYVLDHSALIAGLVLSGSAAVDKLAIDPSQDADLTVFNRAFEPARTQHDWLSRDPAAVDTYEADPLCGFGINKTAMPTMAAGASRLVDPAALAQIRKDLPIYIFAGDKDPINHGLEWLRPVAERYRAAGIANVSEKYYPKGRHEMLNETNRDEVMRNLASWLSKTIEPQEKRR